MANIRTPVWDTAGRNEFYQTQILPKLVHPEKCFVESTKILLELVELTKKILLNFFAIPTKKFSIDSKKHGIAN